MRPLAAALLGALAVAACGRATAPPETYVPGRTYPGANGYVEYVAGDLPIVLGAPHGGDLAPDALPDRTEARCGATEFSATNDLNTQELARTIADTLHARTGRRAHLVVSRLHRRKLDANRDSVPAACGGEGAGAAWHEYHAFLDSARAAVARTGRGAVRGLMLDVHGHAHRIARVELGYLVSGAQLDLSDAALDASRAEDGSSIRALSRLSPLAFSALLRGPASVGGLLEARGYAAVPAPGAPGPRGESCFSGGYSTERHGCANGTTVCAVQAELPLDGVRRTEAERQRFAGAVAAVLLDYLRAHADVRP